MGKLNYDRTLRGRVYDGCARVLFRAGYPTLKLIRRIHGPRSFGVGVVIRHDDRVLAVRHSYRPGYDIPGGGIGWWEHPRQTAVRELAEELSIYVEPDALVYKRRHHRSHLFELTFDREPDIRIDNREIVEAVFLSREEAITRNPAFRHFI